MARKNPDMTTWLLLGGVALGAYLIYKAKKGKPAQAATKPKPKGPTHGPPPPPPPGGPGFIAAGAGLVLRKDPAGQMHCMDVAGNPKPMSACQHLVAAQQLEGLGSLGSTGLGSLGGCGMGSLGAC